MSPRDYDFMSLFLSRIIDDIENEREPASLWRISEDEELRGDELTLFSSGYVQALVDLRELCFIEAQK